MLANENKDLIGDLAREPVVTWQLIHKFNVASMIKHGILDPNSARIKLKNLKQGSLDVDVFIDAFDNHFAVAHPTGEILNFLPDLIDGFSDSIASPHREATPHVAPFQSRILALHSEDKFKDKSFPECRSMFNLEQSKMRRDLRVAFDTPYAPYDPNQPGAAPHSKQLQISAVDTVSTISGPGITDAMQSFLTGQGKLTEAFEKGWWQLNLNQIKRR